MSLKGSDYLYEKTMAVLRTDNVLRAEGIDPLERELFIDGEIVCVPSAEAFERLCVLYDRLCRDRNLCGSVEWWYTCQKCGQLVREGDACDCWKAQFQPVERSEETEPPKNNALPFFRKKRGR